MELKISHGIIEGGGFASELYYIIITCMELKISHGIIEGGGFARERSDQARGELWERGFPPPTVGRVFIFRP